MKKLNSIETRSISGGKTVYCPICGKKSSIWFWQSAATERMHLEARHCRGGRYNRSSSVHR